jgi:voltage-gated potassium channel
MSFRQRLYTIIFEADTRAGKLFDEVLIAAILLSLVVVVLDSVESIASKHSDLLTALEWGVHAAVHG